MQYCEHTLMRARPSIALYTEASNDNDDDAHHLQFLLQ